MNSYYYTNPLNSIDLENPNNPPYPHSSSPISPNPNYPCPNPSQNQYPNPPQNMEPTPEVSPTNKRSKSKKTYWSREEEILLAKAWLHISEDSIKGTAQRDKEFWQRINTYYQSSNTTGTIRAQTNLKTHWHYMNPLVVAFNQIYLVLKSQHLSGWSDEDLKKGAFEHYSAIYATDFRHDHIWNLVKNEPKWKAAGTTSEASRSSSNAQSLINLDDNEDTSRPIGTKAAKKAIKCKASKSTSSSSSRLDEILEKHVHDNKKKL
ncbi:unnamed protein product [Lactuca virosa]|uniref:No apical meristem-associated C-terminal domain-containing protein n=1 Tax=Lactuca virosa TaxID=75947 RepID=A0AAU9N2P7_9ASTR|nr:unnamed protein product [Lactuca virosa]